MKTIRSFPKRRDYFLAPNVRYNIFIQITKDESSQDTLPWQTRRKKLTAQSSRRELLYCGTHLDADWLAPVVGDAVG